MKNDSPIRVLAISPHFPPSNTADHQRLRTALPYLRDLGVDIHVLACEPHPADGVPQDPFLEEGLPSGLKVTKVKGFSPELARRFGVGNIALRSLAALARGGAKLMRRESFDLAFFTSTQFACYPLGLAWKRLYGLPYVLDIQDPWPNDYYYRRQISPPGGWKFHVQYAVNSVLSRRTVAGAAGIVRTSAAYRFPSRNGPVLTLPFGAPTLDFQRIFRSASRGDGDRTWVAIGRGGADLAPCLTAFFRALALARDRQPELFRGLRVRFLGTSYAPRGHGKPTIRPLAARFGLGDMVEEQTDRLGYRESLQTMVDADAIIIPTSDDGRYNPSKLASVVLAGPPVLALAARGGKVAQALQSWGVGEILDPSAPSEESARLCVQLLTAPRKSPDPKAFRPHTAEAMSGRLARFLRSAASRAHS